MPGDSHVQYSFARAMQVEVRRSEAPSPYTRIDAGGASESEFHIIGQMRGLGIKWKVCLAAHGSTYIYVRPTDFTNNVL